MTGFKLIFFWGFLVWGLSSFAQIHRPDSHVRHMAIANAGYDHNLLSLNLGYAYYLKAYKTAAFIDITQGTALAGTSNLRTQIGLQTWKGSFNTVNLRTLLALVYTHSENKAGNYDALGLNVQVNAGLHGRRVGLGADFQYNPFFSTHIRHTDFYRQYYYADVKDGWYSFTTHTFRLGGYLLVLLDKSKSIEMTLRGGYQTSGQLDQLIPPFFSVVGFTKKF